MSAQSSKATVEQKSEFPPIEGLNPNGFFNESTIKESCSVKVAVRVRPMLPRELAAGDSSCIQSRVSQNSITVGLDKSFSFDKVFGIESKQEEIFDVCVKNLVLSSFAGYNATVLAYGQTCSGKTFTMGTDPVLTTSKGQQGIIPRVIQMIFEEIEKRKATCEFIVKVSFIEIYNEEIKDLLDPQGQSKITVRELTRGVPSLCGQQEERVSDFDGLFRLLERGGVHRRTRSTLMNDNSSRSHAILEINIEQHLISDLCQSKPTEQTSQQEFVTAKFHFVDLAGSERIKRTGAEGETLQEGISINKALFVLGKVINALTDDSGRSIYKPYRESNLTRILQDSLGGNARTTMIACVSPAESNYEETLSTLLYACKARNIKNKPIVNRDPNSTLIHQLQQQVIDLQRELGRFKKSGPLLREATSSNAGENILKAELASLKRENETLKARITQMEDENRKKEIDYLEMQKQRDVLQLQNEKLRGAVGSEGLVLDTEELGILEQYQKTTSELQDKVKKQREEIEELQRKYEEEYKNANIQSDQMIKLNQELQRTRRSLVKTRSIKDRSTKENMKSIDEAAGIWLSEDLNEQLKEVQDVFINELSQSLGTLIPDTTKEINDATKDGEIVKESPMKENEEGEEIEENKKEEEMKATLNKVEGDIHEREKMLIQIKEKHKEMQKNLISIMENQYHKKVEELEKEMEKLKNDKEKAVQFASKDDKRSIEQQYKKRMTEYEQKIKEYRKNESNKQKLLKQANEQENKIQSMTEEIMKMKQQKLELARKLRKERENYEKSKREQMREALKLKQETIKQKIIITKLTKEKERAAKLKENSKHELAPISSKVENYKGLINEFSTQLANIKQESNSIKKEEQKQKELNLQLEIEYGELYKLQLQAERIEVLKKEYDATTDYDKIEQAEESLEGLQKKISAHQFNIDNLESTLRYHEEKMVRLELTKTTVKTQLIG